MLSEAAVRALREKIWYRMESTTKLSNRLLDMERVKVLDEVLEETSK